MNKITKFQRIQILLSVIPFFSTFFAFIATAVELKRKKATWIAWVCCYLIIILAWLLYTSISVHICFDEYPGWNILLATGIYACANCALVCLQLFSNKAIESGDHKRITKIAIIVLCSLALVLALILCVFTFADSDYVHMEDINGADTSLAIITMEEISATRETGTSIMLVESSGGENSKVDGMYSAYDHDNYRFKCKKRSGIFTLQSTKVEENTLTLTVDTVLTVGNAEILIFIDEQYYQHIPIGRNQKVALNSISGKDVVVKMAAESAEVELSIVRDY